MTFFIWLAVLIILVAEVGQTAMMYQLYVKFCADEIEAIESKQEENDQ